MKRILPWLRTEDEEAEKAGGAECEEQVWRRQKQVGHREVLTCCCESPCHKKKGGRAEETT